MENKNKLNLIAFHITDNCSAHCPMCYEEACKGLDLHGEFVTLKKIIHNAIAFGKVEQFLMVGGDPCEHPHLMELLKYIREEGKKHNINTSVEVLSNTHEYKENGKVVPMSEVAKYVDKLNVTVHGETPEIHDAFNGVKGSYRKMMDNVKEFIAVKDENQSVGITVNVMPSTIHSMDEIIYSANMELLGQVKDVCVQRIAPTGRASETTKYYIEKQDVDVIMPILDMVKKNGIGIKICDCFPYCSVKPEFRHLLPVGGCNWGSEIISVKPNGDVTRCALSSQVLSRNMASFDSEEDWRNWWENDPALKNFRNKTHLSEHCKKCAQVRNCGGGCLIAQQKGSDYLAR